jgi:hypothetical protein
MSSTNAQIETPTPAIPPAGTPEYDAYMIAKAEGSTWKHTDGNGQTTDEIPPADPAAPEADPKAPPAAERPEYIPEKFWTGDLAASAKKMADSYAELERSRSKPADPAAPTPADPKATPADPKAAPTGSLGDILTTAAEEFAASRSFTEDTIAKLEAAGISRQYADTYVKGLEAQAAIVEREVWDAAGGKEQFAEIQAWASEALTDKQLAAHNRALEQGDLETTLGAISTLRSLYESANGKGATRRVEPNGGSNAAIQGETYTDKAQVVADMANPKYHSDSAFRATVAKKLENTMRAGVELGL